MNTIAGHPAVDSYVPPEFGRGYIPRDKTAFPLGAMNHGSPPSIKRLSKAEIKEAAEYKTANKTWIKDKCDRVGLKVKNQSNSNYCWGHGLTRCCEVAYMFSGGRVFTLAAFDVCACIKGGRNQGGSGVEAGQWVMKNGICREDLHKPMDFDSSRSAEQSANAALHIIDSADDIDPGDHELIYSYVIADVMVTVGIPVWSHEVGISYLALEGSDIYPGIDNSWGDSYGDHGRAVLHGAYTRFDEAFSVRSMTPSKD